MIRDIERCGRGLRTLIVCGALCTVIAASGPQVVAASTRASDSGAAAAPTAIPPTYQSAIFQPGGLPPLSPNATALAPNGTTLYASDEEGQRIVTVDLNTNQVTELSPTSNGWSHPSGLYLEADQAHLLVADKDHNRIVEIDTTTGAFTRRWGGAGTPTPAMFNAPEDMTMDAAGNIYVNDTYHYQVIGLSASTGQILWQVTKATIGPGPGCDGTDLLRNRGITIGSDGNLYVSLTDRGQILALDPATGSCLRVFGKHGFTPGSFAEPRGIWTDGAGGLWVAENGNARIQHVKLDGTPIWVSPTTFGSAPGQIRSPHGLQFVPGPGGTGSIYLSDTYNYRIAVYTQVAADGSATLSSTVQEPLPANGGFDAPFGVAYDSSGNLFVVDHYNSRAEEFDSSGNFVGQVGGAGVPLGSMNFPRGIVVLPSNSPKWPNDIMVCDSENHRMQIFTPASFTANGLGTQPVGRLTPTGTTFLRPQQISMGPDGTLWVADTNHHRILDVSLTNGAVIHNWAASGNPRPAGIIVDSTGVYVTGTNLTEYTPTGAFIRTIAPTGTTPGKVRSPDGMAIDSTGTVLYVADTYNNRVDEFSLPSGSFIQSFGQTGSGDGQFNQPYMVAISSTGQIAVSDFGNNRVSIWHA